MTPRRRNETLTFTCIGLAIIAAVTGQLNWFTTAAVLCAVFATLSEQSHLDERLTRLEQDHA